MHQECCGHETDWRNRVNSGVSQDTGAGSSVSSHFVSIYLAGLTLKGLSDTLDFTRKLPEKTHPGNHLAEYLVVGRHVCLQISSLEGKQDGSQTFYEWVFPKIGLTPNHPF